MNSAQHAESGHADMSGERGAHLLQDCPQHLLPDLPRATTENRRPISRPTNNMRDRQRCKGSINNKDFPVYKGSDVTNND